jgi:tetratricopeptide (TPR) repeat protein
MKRFVVLCLAGWLLTGATRAQPPEPKPATLTKEQQDKLKERDQFLMEAKKLQAEGKLTEAVAAAEKMLAIERELYGKVHPEVAESLQLLAQMYEVLEDFPAARKARQEVLAIQIKLRGAQHWQVTDARLALEGVERLDRMTPADRRRLAEAAQLHGRVVELYQQGKAPAALPLAQKILGIHKEVLGEHHPDYVSSLNNLARLYLAQGAYAKAESLYRQALDLRKRVLGERHPAYAKSLNNLAVLYMYQGDYAQAEPLLRQSLVITKQALGERHPEYAASLHNLAALYQEQGAYAKAEPLLRQALMIQKQVLGERHPDYAISLTNLAALYEDQGEYAQAESLYRQALAIKKQVRDERHPSYATSLNNLAKLYCSQGEYTKAEPLLRQARDIYKQALGERHPDYATSLHNLATLYQEQGEYAQAESLYRQALDLRKRVLGERHPDYATSLNNLAALYEDQGEYPQAESLYRQALEIKEQALGEHHPDYAISLDNLANLYKSQARYTQAESLCRQAVAALRQRPEGPPIAFEQLTAADLRPLPDTVRVLANYCVLLEQRLGPRPTTAQLRAADHAFTLALAVRERLRQEVLQQDASKLHHGAEELHLFPSRIGLCERLFDRESKGADLETALATAEQGSARVFLEQLGKARALTIGRVGPELRAQETALRRQLRELDVRIGREQDKPSDKRDLDKVGRLLDQHKQVEAQLTTLIRRMEQEYPQYAALKYPHPSSLAEARACLAPTEVALLFVPGDQRSYVILVEAQSDRDDKAHGLAIYPLPSHDDLADGISLLTDRDYLERPSKARAAGQQAYELLLAPVKDRIRGKDLVIVPGGPLA